MQKIQLPVPLQKTLIENYAKANNLNWQQMAKEFNLGYSTLRYSYRTGRLCLPLHIFQKIVTNPCERNNIFNKYQIYNVGDKSKIPNNSNSSKAKLLMIKKHGKNIFIKLAKKGAAISNKLWTEERRLKQSAIGKRGGIKRIEHMKFLTNQERFLAEENKKFDLIFKTNHFISPNMNFDFVYFDNNKIVAVEEATLNPFRSFAYFIEKRKFLDEMFNKNFPFVLTISNTKNSSFLIKLLIKSRIIVVKSLEDRTKILKSNFKFNPKFKFKNIKTKAAETELKRAMTPYEELVNSALIRLNLKPLGKRLLRKNTLSIVTDNSFIFHNKRVNVLVAYAKSRGSLFYQLYKNATYGYLIKHIFKEGVMVVIFDFTSTVSSKSENLPRKLCLNNCDFYAITFKNNITDLSNALKNALGW